MMTLKRDSEKDILEFLRDGLTKCTYKTYFSYYSYFSDGVMFLLYKKGDIWLRSSLLSNSFYPNAERFDDEKNGVKARNFFRAPEALLTDSFMLWSCIRAALNEQREPNGERPVQLHYRSKQLDLRSTELLRHLNINSGSALKLIRPERAFARIVVKLHIGADLLLLERLVAFTREQDTLTLEELNKSIRWVNYYFEAWNEPYCLAELSRFREEGTANLALKRLD